MSNKKYNRITEIKITINTDQKEVIVKSTGNGHIIIEDKNGKEIRPEKPRITRKHLLTGNMMTLQNLVRTRIHGLFVWSRFVLP